MADGSAGARYLILCEDVIVGTDLSEIVAAAVPSADVVTVRSVAAAERFAEEARPEGAVLVMRPGAAARTRLNALLSSPPARVVLLSGASTEAERAALPGWRFVLTPYSDARVAAALQD